MTYRVMVGWRGVVRYLRLRSDRRTYDADLRGDQFDLATACALADQYGGRVVR